MTTTAPPTELSVLRKGRITASRVAGVTGYDPRRGPDDVLREMVRDHFGDTPDFAGNWLTNYGKEHELDALAQYEEDTGSEVRNTGQFQITVVHPELDFLAATPDGWVHEAGSDDASGLAEVKCPPRAQYVHIADRPDYGEQVQHQVACTGFDWCDFGVWRPGHIEISTVLADPNWLEKREPVLRKFHEHFLEVIADPELAAPYRKPLIDIRDDGAWDSASEEYLDLVMAEKALTTRKELAKARLIELAGDAEKVRGGGLLLFKTAARAGSVDWKRALAEHAPDVDPEAYRKPSGPGGWTIRPAGEKS